jgi:hypothetical protein
MTTAIAQQPFERFYNLCSTAIWDLFVSGHVENETKESYDFYMDSYNGRHVIAICAGTFTETPYDTGDTKNLGIDKAEWSETLHEDVEIFFSDLSDIIEENEITGVRVVDRKDFFYLEINSPHDLLKLIGLYLDDFDINTLDDITPEDLPERDPELAKLPPDQLAKKLRMMANKAYAGECFEVKSVGHVDIHYFPVTASPTPDTADIALIDAHTAENVAPFSYDLLANTLWGYEGRTTPPLMGLALLH